MADVEISSSGQKFYMRYELHMSRYGGILGGGHLPWVLSLLVLEGGSTHTYGSPVHIVLSLSQMWCTQTC